MTAKIPKSVISLLEYVWRLPQDVRPRATGLRVWDVWPYETASVPESVRAYFADLRGVGGANRAAREANTVVRIEIGKCQKPFHFLWNSATKIPVAAAVGEGEDMLTFVFNPHYGQNGRWVEVLFGKSTGDPDK